MWRGGPGQAGGAGGTRVTDLVSDDLATRFVGVIVLASLVVDGQIYLVAGGSDDGISPLALVGQFRSHRPQPDPLLPPAGQGLETWLPYSTYCLCSERFPLRPGLALGLDRAEVGYTPDPEGAYMT